MDIKNQAWNLAKQEKAIAVFESLNPKYPRGKKYWREETRAFSHSGKLKFTQISNFETHSDSKFSQIA